VRRPSYDAWARALSLHPQSPARLAPIEFRHGDFQDVVQAEESNEASLVLCVHVRAVGDEPLCSVALAWNLRGKGLCLLAYREARPLESRLAQGCKEVNRDAVVTACEGGAGWFIVPCCLTVDHYLPAASSVRLPDTVRYAALCGAMASEFDASFVWALDGRITKRGIVMGGGRPWKATRTGES
jgi:DNA-binding transcriptional LysR family regulator